MKTNYLVGIAISLVIITATTANATQIDVVYSGEIDRLTYSESIGSSWNHTDLTESFFYDGLRISTGEIFSGNFSYNPDTPISGSSYLGATTNLNFSSTNISLPNTSLPTSSIGNDILVTNNGLFGWDTFYVSSWFSNDLWFASMNIDLMDHDGTVYSDVSIPTSFNLGDFETLYFSMSFLQKQSGDQLHIKGHLSDFAVATNNSHPVPVPSAVLLLSTGLAGLVGIRHKRKNRK